MSNFDNALAFILRPDIEGGVVNDPDDPGGLTDRGVTQRVYTGYRQSKGLPDQPVTKMTVAECAELYRKQYWDPIGGDSLPPLVGLVVFDAAVNQGVGYATKLLQWGAGVIQDGKVGPVTLAAIAAKDEKTLAEDLIWARLLRYVAICRAWQAKNKPNPWKFIYGWTFRLTKVWALLMRTPGLDFRASIG